VLFFLGAQLAAGAALHLLSMWLPMCQVCICQALLEFFGHEQPTVWSGSGVVAIVSDCMLRTRHGAAWQCQLMRSQELVQFFIILLMCLGWVKEV